MGHGHRETFALESVLYDRSGSELSNLACRTGGVGRCSDCLPMQPEPFFFLPFLFLSASGIARASPGGWSPTLSFDSASGELFIARGGASATYRRFVPRKACDFRRLGAGLRGRL